MIISDTSALVLNWTSPEIWKSSNAQNYFSKLDLSAGDELLKKFDIIENFMHTQAVTNRKFFVRKNAVEFLGKNPQGQVIILGAGIAPLSVELTSLYPESIIFDVDKYQMKLKKQCLNGSCPNINFIECDVTNIEKLHKYLNEYGWNRNQPMILIMEGIIYYLPEEELRNILKFFAESNSLFVCDFGINLEMVHENNRKYGTEVFQKIIDEIRLDSVSFYEPDYFLKMVRDCGFKLPRRFTMRDIQIERTENPGPFDFEEPGWISCVAAG